MTANDERQHLKAMLQLADEQISVLSVRQVLSRLCAWDLVQRDDSGLYRLAQLYPQAASVARAG